MGISRRIRFATLPILCMMVIACANENGLAEPNVPDEVPTVSFREVSSPKEQLDLLRTEVLRLAAKARGTGKLSSKEAGNLRRLMVLSQSMRQQHNGLNATEGDGPEDDATVLNGNTIFGGAEVGTSTSLRVWSQTHKDIPSYPITNVLYLGQVTEITWTSLDGSSVMPDWTSSAPISNTLDKSRVLTISGSNCVAFSALTRHEARRWFLFPHLTHLSSDSRVQRGNEGATCPGEEGGGGNGGPGENCHTEEIVLEIGYYNEFGGIDWYYYDTITYEECEYET